MKLPRLSPIITKSLTVFVTASLLTAITVMLIIDRNIVYKNNTSECNDLPDRAFVEETINANVENWPQIIDLNGKQLSGVDYKLYNNIGGFWQRTATNYCPEKADILFRVNNYDDAVRLDTLLQDQIGDTFYGVPYRIHYYGNTIDQIRISIGELS